MDKKKWTIVGTASALGIGIVAVGAMGAANAMTLVNSPGSPVGVDSVNTHVLPQAPRFIGSPATPSAVSATTAGSTVTPSVASSVSPASAVTPPSVPSPVSVVTPASPVTPPSPPSAVTPPSPASPASPASAGSSD